MGDNRYSAFIEKIIHYTKEDNVTWHYLDSREELYKSMHWTKVEDDFGIFGQREKVYMDFNREDSFYTVLNGTYIVLLVRKTEPATMYIVPNTYKKVVQLDADQYGEYITRLHNLVQAQFPDGEVFIDSILNEQDD